MDLSNEEIWDGHAWALREHADRIGPMLTMYDDYDAAHDLRAIRHVIMHAEWLKLNIETRFPKADEGLLIRRSFPVEGEKLA